MAIYDFIEKIISFRLLHLAVSTITVVNFLRLLIFFPFCLQALSHLSINIRENIASKMSKEALLKSYNTRLKDDVKSMLENFEGMVHAPPFVCLYRRWDFDNSFRFVCSDNHLIEIPVV